MSEPATTAVYLAVFFAGYAVIFGIAALVQHVKRDSPRWQSRSDRQRRLLARLPGVVIVLVIYAVVFLIAPTGA